MSMPAKLTAPRLGRQVVTRERVNRLVDDAACSGAVWIEAPAGFGKTVVAADWARTRRANLLWYELDDADVDAAGFLHYLREAATARTRRGCRLPHAFAPDVRQFFV